MNPNRFRSALLRGERLFGTMITLGHGAVAEVLVESGVDWLFVDGEHGPFDAAELQTVLQAVAGRVPCLVRVPTSDEAPIKRALDLGATGVIVPQVNSADQAARVVQFSRYPPQGARGVGIARAHGYGARFQSYVGAANDETVVVVQAEHIQAVEQIEKIVAVAGVDCVLIGPYDLSASLGQMGQIDHPSVVQAIEHVTAVCRAARMPLGIFGVTAAAVRPYLARGYSLLTCGVDTILLSQATRQMLSELRTAD